MKKPTELLQSIRNAVTTAITDYRDDKLISNLIEGVTQSPQIYRGLLANQLVSLRQSQVTPEMQKLMMVTAKKTIDQVITVGAMVGIQPMQGPVGLGFVLRWKDRPQQIGPLDTCNHGTLEVRKIPLAALTRKLSAKCNIEARQDLRLIHGIDVDEIFASVMGNELATEIITELVTTVFNGASTIATYEGHDPLHILMRINTLSTTIGQKTRRGVGRVIVTSSEGDALLQQLTGSVRYEPVECKEPPLYPEPMFLAGHIMSKDTVMYTVYVTTVLPSDDSGTIPFMVAYKGGNGEVDAGLIYSPYVLALSGGMVIDPNTFARTMTFSTRYSIDKDDDSMDYYATLVVTIPPKTTNEEV